MQSQLYKQPSILNQLIIVCGLGLILGIAAVMIPVPLILMGIGGIIYIIVAWFWPEIAILGILLFTATIFDIYAYPSIPIGIGNLIISDILLFVLIGIMLLRGIIYTASYFIRTPLDMPLLAFWGTAILATAIGIFNSRITFNQSLGEVRYVNFYLIFFIVTNLVRNEKQLRRLYGGIVFLAIFVALAMIAQYVLGPAVPILPGRVETLRTAGETSYGVTRVLPPGQSLVMLGFVFLAVQMLFNKTSSQFIVHFFQLSIIGLAVLLTFNRSFWAAIIIALFLVGLFVSLRAKIKYTQFAIWTVLVGFFVLIPFRDAKGSQIENLVNGITARMSTLFDPDTTQESSLQYRYVENKYAYSQIGLHPLIGLGLGANYRPWDHRIDAGATVSQINAYYIHNGHLWIMLKTGLIGYLFYMWFVLLYIKRAIQNWKRISDPLQSGIILSFATIMIGVLFAAFVNPVFRNSYWTPVIGVMMGIGEIVLRMNRDRIGHSHALEIIN